MSDDFTEAVRRARDYGLGEFLEIIGELSQESTKRGVLGRRSKELITYGIALYKGCRRCIRIHERAARQLEASDAELELVRRVHLFLRASPLPDKALWRSWKQSWTGFLLARHPLPPHEVELVALGIALVAQSGRHIRLHTRGALAYGADQRAVFEVVPLALLMDGAPALSQIPRLVKAVDRALRKAEAAGG